MEEEDGWEEEQLVLVELSGILEQEILYNARSEHCRLLGIEASEPVLQIGPYTFIGHYEEMAGTSVMFEEQDKSYKYKGHTTKSLKMTRAFLKNKSEASESKDASSTSPASEELTSTKSKSGGSK